MISSNDWMASPIAELDSLASLISATKGNVDGDAVLIVSLTRSSPQFGNHPYKNSPCSFYVHLSSVALL